MIMNGIKDFQAPQYVDIIHPDKGFFGYLLRCKCPKQEDVSGNFIFLDDGIRLLQEVSLRKESQGRNPGRIGTAVSAVTMIFSKVSSAMSMKN